jgi:hypothetical protein
VSEDEAVMWTLQVLEVAPVMQSLLVLEAEPVIRRVEDCEVV